MIELVWVDANKEYQNNNIIALSIRLSYAVIVW